MSVITPLRIAPEACTPENFIRLGEELVRRETQVKELIAKHEDEMRQVRAAAGIIEDPDRIRPRELREVLELIAEESKVYRNREPCTQHELSEQIKYRESVERSARTWKSRASAYDTYMSEVHALANLRNPALVWISGAQLLAIWDRMIKNEDTSA
jgi:hypothetical protein